MNIIERKRDAISVGSVVAFSKAADATWFEVIKTHGDHGLEVREAGTGYQTQLFDRCYVEQVKAA